MKLRLNNTKQQWSVTQESDINTEIFSSNFPSPKTYKNPFNQKVLSMMKKYTIKYMNSISG